MRLIKYTCLNGCLNENISANLNPNSISNSNPKAQKHFWENEIRQMYRYHKRPLKLRILKLKDRVQPSQL